MRPRAVRRTWPGCAPHAHTPRYLGERRPLSLACASSPTVRALGGIDLAVPDGDEKAEPFSDAPSARSSESPLCEARGVSCPEVSRPRVKIQVSK